MQAMTCRRCATKYLRREGGKRGEATCRSDVAGAIPRYAKLEQITTAAQLGPESLRIACGRLDVGRAVAAWGQ